MSVGKTKKFLPKTFKQVSMKRIIFWQYIKDSLPKVDTNNIEMQNKNRIENENIHGINSDSYFYCILGFLDITTLICEA